MPASLRRSLLPNPGNNGLAALALGAFTTVFEWRVWDTWAGVRTDPTASRPGRVQTTPIAFPGSSKETSPWKGVAVHDQPRKLSEIMKEMAESLLRDPRKVPSPEAVQVALLYVQIAWNESVGLENGRDGIRNVWEPVEAENPTLWNEFKSSDITGLLDELVKYKETHYSSDQRRILTCGMQDEVLRVEWLPPAAPRVDSNSEMRLYGLVRVGRRDDAIRFLKETRRMSASAARAEIKRIAAYLGIR